MSCLVVHLRLCRPPREPIRDARGRECADGGLRGECRQTFDEAVALLYGPRPNGARRRRNVLAAAEAALAADRAANPPKHVFREPADPAERLGRAHKALAGLRKVAGWRKRRNKVELEWYHYRSTEVARQMLIEAREALPANPEDSERWTELATLALAGDHDS